MKLSRRDLLKLGGLATLGAAAAGAEIAGLHLPGSAALSASAAVASPPPAAVFSPLPAASTPSANPVRLAALSALGHAAFGPRPGEVERVAQMGVDNWLDQQLAPAAIDDSALDRRLAAFPTLAMDVAALLSGYPRGGHPGPAAVVTELASSALLRAVYSERQLLEVLVDFWTNHFNIYIRKDQCLWLKTVDDREVIRRHALGNFHDLLLASAQSPAMLDFLDNRYNVKGTPNENYAREVMELHTLGVDGGYTQADVEEVARCMTGWTLRLPRPAVRGAAPTPAPTATAALPVGFFFNARQHDDGAKTVLGQAIPAGGGLRDGLAVLDRLAHHPSTARFLAGKLARRLVSDSPSDALVTRVAGAFTTSGGDIRQTLSALLHSDEFKASYGQKARRPLETVAAALRALSAETDAGQPLLNVLNLMGQYPFASQATNGYPDAAAAWLNTNGLLARWNFALALAGNAIKGTHVDLTAGRSAPPADADPAALVDFWVARLLDRPIPAGDRSGLIQLVAATPTAARTPALVAMVLSSPHFQWR